MSLRIHASSALVPNAAVISPVVRVHLVHPDLGSPVRLSGEATTPMQTAPFDMTRRRAATFAAEWQETLEVERERFAMALFIGGVDFEDERITYADVNDLRSTLP